VTTRSQGRQPGRFSFDVLTGKWDWDDEVFRIHGHQPGSVKPTTELVLASKHPEDRERVRALLDLVSHTGEPFSISYRIIAADGVERRVVLVGEGGLCEPDETTIVEGFYIDLTTDFTVEAEGAASAAVQASARNRAVIEQAKGALMLAYGLDSDAAFSMLRWWSKNRNIKVRDLARRLVEVAGHGEIADTDLQVALDALLHDLSNYQDGAAG
jgi:hypothetical protein